MGSIILLVCLSGYCLPYGTVFVSTHEFCSFYPSNSLSDPTGGGLREWQCGTWLLTVVWPRQPFLVLSVGHKGFKIKTNLTGMCKIELMAVSVLVLALGLTFLTVYLQSVLTIVLTEGTEQFCKLFWMKKYLPWIVAWSIIMVNTPLQADKVWIKNFSLNIPSNSIQRRNCKIWRKIVLKLSQMDVTQNYFYK